MIKKLAGEEDPLAWADAIAHWLQRYAPDQPVALDELCRGLELPFVAIWLGLLLGGFDLTQFGQLYDRDIVVLG